MGAGGTVGAGPTVLAAKLPAAEKIKSATPGAMTWRRQNFALMAPLDATTGSMFRDGILVKNLPNRCLEGGEYGSYFSKRPGLTLSPRRVSRSLPPGKSPR